MNNEIKFSDGIYISKGIDAKQFTDDGKVLNFPEEKDKNKNCSINPAKIINNDCNTTNPYDLNTKKPSYIYRNTGELIQILECEFIEFQEEICLLKKANEDMMDFDAHDYDLIQAREDNLKIINKRINQLRDLQNKLKEFCPTHPFVLKDVFDIISLIENNRENPEDVLHQILASNSKVDKVSINENLEIEENKNTEIEENRNVNQLNPNEEITGNIRIHNQISNSRDNRDKENTKQGIIQEIDL